jgi:hypothetical protein
VITERYIHAALNQFPDAPSPAEEQMFAKRQRQGQGRL